MADVIPSERDARRIFNSVSRGSVISSSITAQIYDHGASAWRNHTHHRWAPATKFSHSCVESGCRFECVEIDYFVYHERGAASDECVLRHVCAKIHTPDGVRLVCGGREPSHLLMSRSLQSEAMNIVRGSCSDLFMCTESSRVHVCNPALCKNTDTVNNYSGGVSQATPTCSLTGLIHGGPEMVDKYWHPGSVGASSRACELSKRQVLNGKSVFRRRGKNSSVVHGLSWTSIVEDLYRTKDVSIDTADKVKKFLRTVPHRDGYSDAYNEFVVRAYLQICCLFSSEHDAIDVQETAKISALLDAEVTKYVRVNPHPITWSEIRKMQLALNVKYSTTPRLALTGESRFNFIMMYVQKCISFWATICNKTCPPGRTPASRAAEFIFVDFVVASMYLFSSGIVLPETVTNTLPEVVIQVDEVLNLILPPFVSIKDYICDASSANSHRDLIKECIIEAVRDHNLNPLEITMFGENLMNVTIDILPETRRNRVRH